MVAGWLLSTAVDGCEWCTGQVLLCVVLPWEEKEDFIRLPSIIHACIAPSPEEGPLLQRAMPCSCCCLRAFGIAARPSSIETID